MSFDVAYALALKKLSRCERFERELRPVLAEFDSDTVNLVLERLRGRGVINDFELAKRIIESSHGRSVVGRGRLREVLLARGADSSEIHDLLGSLPEESVRAEELLKTRLCVSRAKEGRFLLSRGLDEEAVDAALNRVFGASE